MRKRWPWITVEDWLTLLWFANEQRKMAQFEAEFGTVER